MTDWSAFRAEFPVTRRFAYLNSAATGPVPSRVASAGRAFWDAIETQGDVPLMGEWLERWEHARRDTATLLGVESHTLGFVGSTSHAMNVFARILSQESRRRAVVTLADEFPSTTLPFLHHGFELRIVEPSADADGRPVYRPGDIAAAVDAEVAAVAVSYVQYGTGFKLDVGGVVQACAGSDVRVLCNVTQGVGQAPVALEAWGVDGAALTGHKWLCSGYGNGLIYQRPEWMLAARPPDLGWLGVENFMAMRNDGYIARSDAAVHELGTGAFTTRFALGEAARFFAQVGPAAIAERIRGLTDYLVGELEGRGYRVISPRGAGDSSGAVSFECPDTEAQVAALLARDIVVVPRGPGRIRCAVHAFNDRSDLDRLLDALPARGAS